MTRPWVPILAAAAAAMAPQALAQEALVLPEPEPIALNCGYASLSPADLEAARSEVRNRLVGRSSTRDPGDKARDKRSLAAGRRCAKQFGLSRRRTVELGTYASLKVMADLMRTSIVPAASRDRIDRFVLAMTPEEIHALIIKGNKESGDLSARLMQVVFAADVPATEQSVREAMLYAVAVMMIRRARVEWAGEDERASAPRR